VFICGTSTAPSYRDRTKSTRSLQNNVLILCTRRLFRLGELATLDSLNINKHCHLSLAIRIAASNQVATENQKQIFLLKF